jgi:hypothetical protein
VQQIQTLPTYDNLTGCGIFNFGSLFMPPLTRADTCVDEIKGFFFSFLTAKIMYILINRNST